MVLNDPSTPLESKLLRMEMFRRIDAVRSNLVFLPNRSSVSTRSGPQSAMSDKDDLVWRDCFF